MRKKGVARSGSGESRGSQLRPRSTSGSGKEESRWEPPEFGNSGVTEEREDGEKSRSHDNVEKQLEEERAWGCQG